MCCTVEYTYIIVIKSICKYVKYYVGLYDQCARELTVD